MKQENMLVYRNPYILEFMYGYNSKNEITLEFYAGNDAVQNIVMQPTDNEPKRLYHYCSFEAFSNIVLSRKIWLTPLSNMNDKKEVLWFLELLDRNIHERNKSEKQNLLYMMLKAIIMLNLEDAYASCYTTLCDNFEKWEIYGDKQCGICFEINPRVLPITRDLPFKGCAGEQNLNSCAFLKINYDHEQQNDAILNVLNLISKNNKVFEYANYLSKVAYFCKRRNFKTEEEWRILYSPKINLEKINEINDFNKFDISSLKDENFVKHYEIPLLNGFITKIIIGSESKIKKSDIMYLIQKSGLDNINNPIEIVNSDI